MKLRVKLSLYNLFLQLIYVSKRFGTFRTRRDVHYNEMLIFFHNKPEHNQGHEYSLFYIEDILSFVTYWLYSGLVVLRRYATLIIFVCMYVCMYQSRIYRFTTSRQNRLRWTWNFRRIYFLAFFQFCWFMGPVIMHCPRHGYLALVGDERIRQTIIAMLVQRREMMYSWPGT